MIDNTDEFVNNLEATLSKNLLKAAIYYKTKVKEAINRSQPRTRIVGSKGVYYKGLQPSEPGQEPKKLTGFLQRSIAHEMSSDGKEAYVGSNLPYALYLELGTSKMAARPFFRQVLAREQEAIAKIIITGSR